MPLEIQKQHVFQYQKESITLYELTSLYQKARVLFAKVETLEQKEQDQIERHRMFLEGLRVLFIAEKTHFRVALGEGNSRAERIQASVHSINASFTKLFEVLTEDSFLDFRNNLISLWRKSVRPTNLNLSGLERYEDPTLKIAVDRHRGTHKHFPIQ